MVYGTFVCTSSCIRLGLHPDAFAGRMNAQCEVSFPIVEKARTSKDVLKALNEARAATGGRELLIIPAGKVEDSDERILHEIFGYRIHSSAQQAEKVRAFKFTSLPTR